MRASNRGFRGKHDHQPDYAGNRKSFDDLRVPPDNIGNKVDISAVNFVHDGMGNSCDEEPSHLKSGILAHVAESMKNSSQKRLEYYSPRENKTILAHNGEEYFEKLKSEFSKLLNAKAGLAFSFSMKPINNNYSWDEANEELGDIYELIEELLHTNNIDASIKLDNYETNLHRFSVFFISPSEHDVAKNKELIAALRQVINNYIAKHVKTQTNIFLVLANAQAIIEEHLFKIGAKKII
jgi:hypothetical protein